MYKQLTGLVLGALLGALLAFLPTAADAGEKVERFCGELQGSNIKYCINIKTPNECGGEHGGGEHCDDTACWCGPPSALTWPGADASGLPLVGREAMAQGWACERFQMDGYLVGACTIGGWACTADGWCQDSKDRRWWADKRWRSARV